MEVGTEANGDAIKEEAVNVCPKDVIVNTEENMTTNENINTDKDEISEEDESTVGNIKTDEEDLGDIIRKEKEWIRRHRFMSIERLNIFSDAVFATITTFMV